MALSLYLLRSFRTDIPSTTTLTARKKARWVHRVKTYRDHSGTPLGLGGSGHCQSRCASYHKQGNNNPPFRVPHRSWADSASCRFCKFCPFSFSTNSLLVSFDGSLKEQIRCCIANTCGSFHCVLHRRLWAYLQSPDSSEKITLKKY